MFLSKISVIITDSKNNDVISKTVTHGQYVLYNPSSTGTHSIRYVTQDKINWDLYITLRNYQINTSSISVLDKNGEEVPALLNDGKIYVYPSESHKNASKLKLFNSFNQSLSLAGLQDQFYDYELEREVANLRDFNIGDSINFKDTISSLEYDPQNNYTLFGFKDKDGDIVKWAFKDDLTSNYSVGDVLELKLKVVEEINGFENIDLIKNFQGNGEVAESIDNYLIK
jgi:hypothetical protein